MIRGQAARFDKAANRGLFLAKYFDIKILNMKEIKRIELWEPIKPYTKVTEKKVLGENMLKASVLLGIYRNYQKTFKF